MVEKFTSGTQPRIRKPWSSPKDFLGALCLRWHKNTKCRRFYKCRTRPYNNYSLELYYREIELWVMILIKISTLRDKPTKWINSKGSNVIINKENELVRDHQLYSGDHIDSFSHGNMVKLFQNDMTEHNKFVDSIKFN